tara:strand:+ start:15524 stop:16645 length:1122 start_codon:yes stop_codon:yes gene_type:complete
MAILHKNITNAADIHNPKWFSNANNGDYAFKNEKGELESIDELLLPAALNFVDASVAPPTSNTGDIYILSSGLSVNAGWGSVSLQDWVRYDGAAWNSITPQKSSLCYDKTADSLNAFDGAAWAAIGGGGGGSSNTIYTADDTVSGNRIVNLNSNNLDIIEGKTSLQGENTLSSSSAFEVYDGDSTPNELVSVKNNGTFRVQNTSHTSLFLDGATGRNSMGMSNLTNSNAFMSIRNANNRPNALRLEDSSGNLQVHLGISALFNHDTSGSKKHLLFAQSGRVKFQQYASSSVILEFNNVGSSHMLGGFAIGGTTRDPSSILDLQATNLGFLPPTMTTTQRNAISSPASGLIVYNTTTNKLNVRGASAWEEITSI